ncbi:MAG: hypothetical protein U0840_09140 [Gemmataceae bacterium]
MMRKLLPLLGLVLLVGCGGVTPSKTADSVDITGRVTLGGKPVSDVVLNLIPTVAGGQQATLPITNGGFQGKAVPGKYTFLIAEGRNPRAIAAIPQKYLTASADRTLDVAAGASLTITLD